MSMADPWELLAALPFVVAGGGLLYILIVGFGGAALRLKRKRRARELEAKRRETTETPWSEWLREINEHGKRGRLDDPTGKWRE